MKNEKVLLLDNFLSSQYTCSVDTTNKLPVDNIFEIAEFITSLDEKYQKNFFKLKKYKRFVKELRNKHKQRLQKIDDEWEQQRSRTLEETNIKIIDLNNFL